MSCACQSDPCTCTGPAPGCNCNTSPCGCPCPDKPKRNRCNMDRRNNVWVEGVVDENGCGGLCLLDTLEDCEIISILECDEVARADLKRVTDDPHLLELAATVKRLPTTEENDDLQSEINRSKDSIPFYSVFRGQPPFAQ